MMMPSILAPVGRNAPNHPPDVRVVQTLLNAIPARAGGPSRSLKVDGLAWAKTVGAIEHFQRAALGFKWPDGRVDPDGKTVKALRALNEQPTQRSSAFVRSAFAGFPIAGHTGWQYRTMACRTRSVGKLTYANGQLLVDNHAKREARLISFVGHGVALGPLPYGSSEATRRMGSRSIGFFKGRRPKTWIAPDPFVEVAVMLTFTGVTGVGASAALIVFGCEPRVRNLVAHQAAFGLPWFTSAIQLANLIHALSYNAAWATVVGQSMGLDVGIAAYHLTIKTSSAKHVPKTGGP